MSEAPDKSAAPELSEALLAAIESGAMEDVESRWLDLLEVPPTDPEFYHQFIRAMRRAKQLERAHELILLALDELDARGAWQAKLDVLRLAARFWPESKALRPHTARALKQVYAHIAQLSDMIAACKGLPLDRVFARFDDFLRMLPGEVYSHPYWGVGMIRELDIPSEKVVVEFPDSEEPRRELALDFLLKHLRYCPPGSFTARLVVDPAALRDYAQNDPVGFIKLVLEDCEGRVKPSELKEFVVGPLFSEAEWTRWWSQARTQLKLDPWIDFDASRGARAEISLRSQPRTFEDEVLETYFDPAATLATRSDAVRQLVRMRDSGANVAADLLGKIAGDLATRVHSQESTAAERLAAFYLLELLASKAPEFASLPDLPSEDSLLESVKDYSALAELPEVAWAQRALKKLVARDGLAGIEQAAALFPDAPPVLAQAIWSVLHPEEHVALAVRALRVLFEKPLNNPETFVWAARQLTERKWAHLEDYVPLAAFTMDLLELLNELDAVNQRMGTAPEQAEKAKWLLGRVRSLITAGDFQLLAHIVQDMSREQVQELRRVIQLHNVFNEAARSAADRAIRLVRRDLDEQAATASPAAPSATGGGPFLCTVKGRARAAAELHELNTVTIPENAKEIEKARSEGDLRENAGYHGARERHAHLLRRAHFLQEGLTRAQVVRKEDVSTETVSFGTRVILTNLDTGAQQTYTILGQWESAPERGIYDYKAPFLAQMLGKKVGEEFVAQTLDGQKSRYRIDTIENALASGEWDTEND